MRIDISSMTMSDISRIAQTCPPGPELLEKESSTAARKMLCPLNRAIHARASVVSLGVVRVASRGATGRLPPPVGLLLDADRLFMHMVLWNIGLKNSPC